MRIIPDTPISHLKDDRLGREPMADLIAESINQLASTGRHPCTVYGIYGKWGEGKTSLMNFVGEKLSAAGEKNKISVIEFNPWLVNNDEALLREFFKTLCSNTTEKIKAVLKKYGSWAVFTSKTIVNAFIPGLGDALSEGVKSAKEAVSDAEDTITELKKKVSSAIVDSGRHLVVMIDDVDRLDKDELHAVLRLIRQVADFDNCIYVVAMDVAMVSKSIGHFYGEDSEQDGRKFLDKIVQVPITLPQVPDCVLKNLIQEELGAILGDYVAGDEVKDIVSSVAHFISTCRELKRYCNQLSFVLPHLKDEVNLRDLCLVEGIKMVSAVSYRRIIEYRPQLARDVSHLKGRSDQNKREEEAGKRYNEAKTKLEEALDGQTKMSVDWALDELFGNVSHDYQEDIDNKRLRTDVYFAKYFTQSVPSDIIADRELNVFVKNSGDRSIEDISLQFDFWLERFPVAEIKRAALCVIRKNALEAEQCKVASVMAQALSTCKASKGLPQYSDAGNDRIASFVAQQVIYRYMFARDEDYANKKPQDSDTLDKTLTYIFANSELNFCLHFLCSANYILRGGKYDGHKVLPILIDRFKAIGLEAQFEYSGYLLLTMLGYWKQADENGFYEYAEKLFTNSEIPLKSVFDKLIGENEGPNDVTDFVKLFRAITPLIVECLKKESEEVRNSYPVRSYLSNYRQLESVWL